MVHGEQGMAADLPRSVADQLALAKETCETLNRILGNDSSDVSEATRLARVRELVAELVVDIDASAATASQAAQAQRDTSDKQGSAQASKTVTSSTDQGDEIAPASASKPNKRPVRKFKHRRIVRTNEGINIDGELYRFPTGQHVGRLLRLFHSSKKQPKCLLDLFAARLMQQAKEISETVGTFMGLVRFQKETQLNIMRLSRVQVFVPGDGLVPRTAAYIYMNSPASWRIFSIDPSMNMTDAQLSDGVNERLSLHKCGIEDFEVPRWTDEMIEFSVVLMVHSHAPLQAFFDSLPCPKVCVSLPCCADFGRLQQDPLLEYDDDEIFSAMRHLLVYYES